MDNVRRFYILIAAAAFLVLLGGPADAFWGGSDPKGSDKSGLDLERGYDRNTVVNVNGRVAAPPRPLASGLVAFELNLPNERIVVVLGPAWYLQDDNLDWQVGDQVTVRGSLAQGKDGQTYLLSQQISVPGRATIMLRGENGSPSWADGIRAGQQGGGSGGQVQRGGGMGGRRGR